MACHQTTFSVSMPANQNLRFVGCVGIDPAHFVLGVLNVLWLSLDSMVSHAEMCAGFIYCSVVFFFLSSSATAGFDIRC